MLIFQAMTLFDSHVSQMQELLVSKGCLQNEDPGFNLFKTINTREMVC